MRSLLTSSILALSLAACWPKEKTEIRTDETKLKVAHITETVTPGSLTVTVEYRPENMATWEVPWKSIRSPFAPSFASDNILLNVSGIKSGTKVKCPYSGKDIIIPELPKEEPEIPTATWKEWAEWTMVFSPFTRAALVDVTWKEPGTIVKCPMTGKEFTIPAMPKPIPDHANAFLKRYQQ